MSPHLIAYTAMAAAIALEVMATTALQASQQFTRPLPTLVMAAGYIGAFYALSHALKVIPIGISYAIWSGIGIVLISLIGFFVFRQKLDLAAIGGIALIVAGVIVINVFSKTATR